jgi:RHS repeat-associated protein
MRVSLMDAPTSRSLLLATDRHNTVLAGFGPSESGHMAYTAYGAQPRDEAQISHSGFNGQLREQGTGWYHLGNGHRVYNPALMRFHSPDALSPFGKGGLNPYTYCLGDPVNHVDPTGRTPDWLQPLLTIGLHTFTIGATVLTAIAAPPIGFALVATRMTLIGSTTAIVASLLALAGVKEARYVAHAGTALSALGALTRLGLGVQNVMAKPELRAAAVTRVGQLFGRPAPKPPQMPRAVPSSAPAKGALSGREAIAKRSVTPVSGESNQAVAHEAGIQAMQPGIHPLAHVNAVKALQVRLPGEPVNAASVSSRVRRSV